MDTRGYNPEELKKLFDSLSPKSGTPCRYCGILSTDKEHVTPRSWIDMCKDMKRMGIDVEIPKEIIVPSCRECNMLALDKVFENIKEKKNYIHEKLKRRYRKLLHFPIWSDEEIMELDGGLRLQVFMFNEVVKIIKRRLRNVS